MRLYCHPERSDGSREYPIAFMTPTDAQISKKLRVVFIGTGEIGAPTLRNLLASDCYELVGVITQPDKPAGRSQKLTAPPIKIALHQSNVPVLQPARIKSSEAIERIRAWEPDVIVVMAYGQILPRAVLEIPRLACLNLHASLLPKYRGAAPIQAAIVAGDKETGITAIYMDEGLDTGDILLQKKVDISPNETGESLHHHLATIAPEALQESLQLLAAGTAPRRPQNSTTATYAPKLTRADGKIDWSESAEEIERKIRAFNPWPGAFMELNGRNVKVFSASAVAGSGKPGEILQTNKDFVVAAGKGALSLREVQLEGKSRMKGVDFARGQRRIEFAEDDAK
jgi:methionyl-tRNA formyltransferase